MTLKACSYWNCQNYVLDNVPCGNFTLFQFPKNLEKRKKWMELGQAPKNMASSTYYYCSDHFDKRFLAVNQRRTILVGEALPYPCSKSTNNLTPDSQNSSKMPTIYLSDPGDVDHEPNNEYILCEMKEIVRETDHDQNDEEDDANNLQVESTIDDGEESNLKHNFVFDFNLEEQSNECLAEEENKVEQTIKVIKKRKLVEEDNSNSDSKIILLHGTVPSVEDEDEMIHITTPTLYESIGNNQTTTGAMELREDINVDRFISHDKEISKFIYKGEEYIQMPLNHYANEKLVLTQKIEKLTNILQAIGGQIDLYRNVNK